MFVKQTKNKPSKYKGKSMTTFVIHLKNASKWHKQRHLRTNQEERN